MGGRQLLEDLSPEVLLLIFEEVCIVSALE